MLSQIGPALMLTGWGQRFTLRMPSTSLDLRA